MKGPPGGRKADMTVTSVEQISKTRARVGIDYENRTLVLSFRDIDLYGLKEGEDIPEALWEKILADQKAQAVRKCGSLLADRDYSGDGLLQKLTGAGILYEAAEYAVSRMEEAGYVNDERVAENYAALHIGDRSLLRIRMDLKARGIPDDVADRVIEQLPGGEEAVHRAQVGQIVKILKKRGYNPEEADYKAEMKEKAYLAGKGYSGGDIREAFSMLGDQSVFN